MRTHSATTGPTELPRRLAVQIIVKNPGLEVVDIGCGTGAAARQFQAVGCTVLGVEPDARMVDFARARPDGRGHDVRSVGASWLNVRHGHLGAVLASSGSVPEKDRRSPAGSELVRDCSCSSTEEGKELVLLRGVLSHEDLRATHPGLPQGVTEAVGGFADTCDVVGIDVFVQPCGRQVPAVHHEIEAQEPVDGVPEPRAAEGAVELGGRGPRAALTTPGSRRCATRSRAVQSSHGDGEPRTEETVAPSGGVP